MNPVVRTFLTYMLTQNLAFMLFFGALLPMVAGLSVHQSFRAGVKHAVVLVFALLAATGLFAILPAQVAPALALLLALLSVRVLYAWGELRGDWGGVPMTTLALLPFAGGISVFRREALSGLEAVSAAFGAATGFFLAFVIIAALIEQIRISEAPEAFRRLATLCFALAVFALAFAGFLFI